MSLLGKPFLRIRPAPANPNVIHGLSSNPVDITIVRAKMIRSALYLWALPTSLVGLSFLPITLLTGGRARVVTGVLEIHSGAAAWFLKYLAFDAAAMTLGHVVLGKDQETLDWSRSHERVHVRQCERWGPFFLPAYGLASLIAVLRGRRAYWDNAFEREAYGSER